MRVYIHTHVYTCIESRHKLLRTSLRDLLTLNFKQRLSMCDRRAKIVPKFQIRKGSNILYNGAANICFIAKC